MFLFYGNENYCFLLNILKVSLLSSPVYIHCHRHLVYHFLPVFTRRPWKRGEVNSESVEVHPETRDGRMSSRRRNSGEKSDETGVVGDKWLTKGHVDDTQKVGPPRINLICRLSMT